MTAMMKMIDLEVEELNLINEELGQGVVNIGDIDNRLRMRHNYPIYLNVTLADFKKKIMKLLTFLWKNSPG